MRFLFVIAAVLVLTSCQTMQSVDRGLYGLSNSVSSQDRITGARTLNIADRPKQIVQGNKYAAQALKRYTTDGKKVDGELDPAQYLRAKKIFSRVLRASHMKDEEWTVHLIPEDSFNAFTTGGTTIFVNLGLMKQLSSDDEVAAVLGHELAHVSANHVFERQAGQMAYSLAGGKTGKSGLVQAAYSRQDETEADNIGILYIALAGYDPSAAAEIWSKMYNSSGADGQMVHSHPVNSERMSNAKAVAGRVQQYYKPGMINSAAPEILKSNALYQRRSEMAAPGQGGGLASILETAANFYVGKIKAKQGAAEESARILTLREIQSNLKLIDTGKAQDGSIGMRFQYVGQRPVGNLALKAVSKTGESVFRVRNVVNPGTQFNAFFRPEIVDTSLGANQKVKLLVDEGAYLR